MHFGLRAFEKYFEKFTAEDSKYFEKLEKTIATERKKINRKFNKIKKIVERR